ncbi:MAG TPA: arsinothricin resistance N-acetyltransferase ArsN1 family A [Baekduia sp.]|nr:arsinothricin resistance N-acetyltransferase ArsN1 family A [Baekduia sp.]
MSSSRRSGTAAAYPRAAALDSRSLSAQVEIRLAAPPDARAIARIYNAGIEERQATFETRLRTPQEVVTWIEGPFPILVADLEGVVVAFARIGPYSERDVYAGIGEHAVYVDEAARGRRVGAKLLEELAVTATHAGYHKLTSRIFTTNAASIALHQAVGFTIVGVQRRHGRLDGEWRDCVLVERLLGAALDGLDDDEAGAGADAQRVA